jgi:hypothetical protein
MQRRKDDAEIESLSTELMNFDIEDVTLEELERRLELTIAIHPADVPAPCTKLTSCGTYLGCGSFGTCGSLIPV